VLLSPPSGPDVARAHQLHLRTPLWYYILKEAEQRGNGERLGPVRGIAR
jgi:hypothetical protein